MQGFLNTSRGLPPCLACIGPSARLHPPAGTGAARLGAPSTCALRLLRRRGRKRWILSVPVKGSLYLDKGAVRNLMDRHTSLFSPGIVKVSRVISWR